MHRDDIGLSYIRGAHDSHVHKFGLESRCPSMTSILYVPGVLKIQYTMFKVCPLCWPEIDTDA